MNANTNTEQLYNDNVLGNYGLPPITLFAAAVCVFGDDLGKSIWISVRALLLPVWGIAIRNWSPLFRNRRNELICVSNLYRNEVQVRLAPS